MPDPRLLFVDDDLAFSPMVKEFLETQGYEVDLFHNGDDGLRAYRNEAYDLCILDVKMPHKDGWAVATELREIDEMVPIIFLTGNTDKQDKLKGFDLGADDYVTKPFSLEELLRRIQAVLKRYRFQQQATAKPELDAFDIGKYHFDCQLRELTFGSKKEKLSAKEAGLLQLLFQHRNQVLKREVALKEVWGVDDYFKGMSMNVYITKLRKYFKEDPRIEILNVHGEGYKLVISD